MNFELQHHYGWTKHRTKKNESLKDAMYRVVRKHHDFLTDDNHTWKITEEGWLQILKNENSPLVHWLCPIWMKDYCNRIWFTCYFKFDNKGEINYVK